MTRPVNLILMPGVCFLLFAAGCTNPSAAPAVSANTTISKYTVTGAAPAGAIAVAPNNPFVNQVSVTGFTPAAIVDLITLAKTATPAFPTTFTESISVSSAAAFSAYGIPSASTLSPKPPRYRLADPLVALHGIRQMERQAAPPLPSAGALRVAPNLAVIASVGATSNFNVVQFDANLNPAGNQVITATCQFDGTNAYIFVDNTIIGAPGTTYSANSPQLQAISTAFDAIYASDQATFGSEWKPGIDGDPKIIILISPAVNSNGLNGLLGYFYGGDEYPAGQVSTSNVHEMFYTTNRQQGAAVDLWDDANTTAVNARMGYAILAHEMQHMINFNTKFLHNGLYNGVIEETWLSEGFAMYAMQVCGYGLPQGDSITLGHVQGYLASPHSYSLTNWSGVEYGIDYLFVLYLVERYGGGVGTLSSQAMLKAMGANGAVGIANVETQTGADGFGTVFKNWAMANLLDNLVADPVFNYQSINLQGAGATYGGTTLTGITPDLSVPSLIYPNYPLNASITHLGWSAVYQRFTGGTNNALNISITSTSAANQLEGVVVVR